MTGGFTRFGLSEGINLYVMPTDKFKTVSAFVYLHTPLTQEAVTANALLPMVLVRGTAAHPTTPDWVRHLDELYGATVGYDVLRRGEVHSLLFKLELPAESYLTEAGGLLLKGLDALADVILRPAMEGDGFKADFVSQEKSNLEEIIKGLINNKMRYAVHRCREIMCQGEAYALHQHGRVEDLPSITPASLYQHWQQVLAQAVVDILVVGNVEADAVAEAVRQRFQFPAGGPRRMPETVVKREAGPLKVEQEPQPVNQGVLVIGFRTGVVARDPDYFAMVVANAILGGYSHSKLFVNVREKHSLAYSAYSAVEAIKGIGFMYAGVEFANFDKARDIMLAQLQGLQNGQISAEEMEATVRSLVNDSLAALDSPHRMVDEFVGGLLAGRPTSVEERVAGFQAARPADVATAAQRFKPEAVYMLTKTA